jgi:HEXXH motif-containing protein
MTETPAAAELARHRLRRDQFEALAAGGGSADAISALLAAERSWRMVQLRALLDMARGHPDPSGPLPPLTEAWELLVAAERSARSDVERLLLSPQTGTWAGYTLRRLRGSAVAEAPLWMDLGYLHALAAAAAIRAVLEFSIRVPVRDGFAAIPTMGGAHLQVDSRWESVEVRGSRGEAMVSARGEVVKIGSADRWLAPPVVRTRQGAHTLSVTLDHVDPYRNLRSPTPPDQLTPEQTARWRALVERAWELISMAYPDILEPMARGLFCVVPQPAAERFRTMSASAGDAFGSLIVSEPEDAPELAVTMVHEFQHIKLGGVLHLVPLQEREPQQRLYAPWRDDPRPLGGLLQGVYAFVGIVEFWRGFRLIADGSAAQLAHFEFARWRRQVLHTLTMLRTLPELTDEGHQLVAGLADTAATWQEEPVPAEVLDPAEAAVADHRARWRLHHFQPDPATVAVLAKAWSAGADRPPVAYPEPVVEADGAARRLDTRAVLALWRLRDPDGFGQLCWDPAEVGTRVSGATAADLAYATGDLARARQLFLAELAAEPGRPSAWAGLALIAEDMAAKALRAVPELVRAVHLASGAAGDPIALASWVGRGVPSEL